jgi:riboflavin biosynthesis pyrimidine reductase
MPDAAQSLVEVARIWPDAAPLDEAGLGNAYALDREKPSVRVNFVASLDGAVEVHGFSRGLSDPTDQRVLNILRVHADAVMVGAGTLRHEGYGAITLDQPSRDWRVAQGLTPDPTLVAVSGSLDLDPGHRMFTQAPVRPVVITHAAAPAAKRAALAEVAEVVDCGGTVVDPALALLELRRRGLEQVLCEGGPHLFGALVAADLVDELCLTLSPQLAGSGASRIVADGRRDTPAQMHLVHLIAAGSTLLSRYARA